MSCRYSCTAATGSKSRAASNTKARAAVTTMAKVKAVERYGENCSKIYYKIYGKEFSKS